MIDSCVSPRGRMFNPMMKGSRDRMFDPMTDIPVDDNEAQIAIRHGKDATVGACGWGLYQIFRIHDGESVVQAYKHVLLAILGNQPER